MIMKAKEHNTNNLTEAIRETEQILNSDTTEQILSQENDVLNEKLHLDNFTLNQIINIHQKKLKN